jgi:hypothetical protein
MQSLQRRFQTLAVSLLLLTALDAFATNTPINLVATPNSSTQITLTWTDNSTDEIGFTFMFDTNGSFTNPQYVWTGGANVTSYVHTGRTAATTYYYRIKAEGATDATDSAFSTTAAATTHPANLAASAASSSQINLSWSGNAANGSITGYTYALNTSASFTGATFHYVGGAGTTSASKTGLNGATTYYFAVKAEGSSDPYDSPFTGWVSATTTTAPTAISTHFYGVNAWMPTRSARTSSTAASAITGRTSTPAARRSCVTAATVSTNTPIHCGATAARRRSRNTSPSSTTCKIAGSSRCCRCRCSARPIRRQTPPTSCAASTSPTRVA